MTASALGDALPIPQEHDAKKRFTEDDYQYQVTPTHRGKPRSLEVHGLWVHFADYFFFNGFNLRM